MDNNQTITATFTGKTYDELLKNISTFVGKSGVAVPSPKDATTLKGKSVQAAVNQDSDYEENTVESNEFDTDEETTEVTLADVKSAFKKYAKKAGPQKAKEILKKKFKVDSTDALDSEDYAAAIEAVAKFI
jgi:hypothetical protein